MKNFVLALFLMLLSMVGLVRLVGPGRGPGPAALAPVKPVVGDASTAQGPRTSPAGMSLFVARRF